MSNSTCCLLEAAVAATVCCAAVAVSGGPRLAVDAGFTHYDEPPPGELEDIERLRATDRFRFANVLRAWIDVDACGQVAGSGYSGGGLMGSAMVKLGALQHRFLAV